MRSHTVTRFDKLCCDATSRPVRVTAEQALQAESESQPQPQPQPSEQQSPTAQGQHNVIARHTDPRIAILDEILLDVSRQTSPSGVFGAFSSQFWRVRGGTDYFVSASTRGLQPGEYKLTRQYAISTIKDLHQQGKITDFSRWLEDQNPWQQWPLLPVYSSGILAELIATGRPGVLNNLDLSSDPVLRDIIPEMRSVIATPLYDEGKPINWAFHFALRPDAFQIDDLLNTMLTGNLFGTATRNLLAVGRAKKLNEELNRQFDEIARIQRSLLPERNPSLPGASIATSYMTSAHAGGDYYDFFDLGDNRWGILIADVSGHGAGAATVMAMLHAILHAFPFKEKGPAAVLSHANERLMNARIEATFVTAIFAVFDATTRSFTFARAGHPEPRLKDLSTGAVIVLEGAAGLPLGVLPDYNIEERTVTLRPGQTLVLYTDGITEARTASGEMFGYERLDEALEPCSGAADCIIDTIHRSLYEFTGMRTRDDDQTIVAIQIHNDH